MKVTCQCTEGMWLNHLRLYLIKLYYINITLPFRNRTTSAPSRCVRQTQHITENGQKRTLIVVDCVDKYIRCNDMEVCPQHSTHIWYSQYQVHHRHFSISLPNKILSKSMKWFWSWYMQLAWCTTGLDPPYSYL